jgi:ATP-dependent Clp protease ATP-binding subunit ClpA
VLFGKLTKGGTVRIMMKDDKLDLAFLGREEERSSLPKPPERKSLPRNTKAKVEEPKKAAVKKVRKAPVK